jgi:uncharacterized protein DUF4340
MTALGRARLVNGGLSVLALLALGLVLLTWRLPSRLELELRQRHVLSLFRESEIQRLVIARGAERAVVVRAPPAAATTATPERAGESARDDEAHDDDGEAGEPEGVDSLPADGWRLLEPLETDADSAAVASLIGSLRYATWVRRLDAGEASAIGGFDAGALTLELEMTSASYRLRLGPDSVSPPGSKYLEVTETRHGPGASSERQVLVIKDTLVQELDRAPESFRGRQIALYSRRTVRLVTLAGEGGERRLERRGEEYRLLGEPAEVRADRVAVERLFLALARTEAQPFLSLEPARAALAQGPRVELTLAPSDAAKPLARLVIGGRCPGREHRVVALREAPEPLAGCVDESVLAALSVPASALVDRGLFSVNLDELERLDVAEGERRLELARKGDGFVLTAPREAELDPDAVTDRLTRLLGLRGERVLPPPAPLSESAAASVVRLTSAAPSEHPEAEQVLYVSAARADGSADVFRVADGATLRIGAEQRLLLAADTGLLKSLAVFDYAARQVKAIEVRTEELEQRFTRSESGDLRLERPRGFEIDGGLALELLDRVRELKALRWVSDRTSDGFGLATPTATVRLEVDVDGRAVERTLTLGQRTAGGFFASVDRDPGVFIAPPALERTLGTWLIDRSLFGVTRGELDRVVLDAGPRGRLTLARAAGQLSSEGSPTLDPPRIEQLLDVLETLRPEAAVHLGPARRGEGLEHPSLTVRLERSAAPGPLPPLSFSIGSRDSFHGASIYYARTSAADATFALPRDQVQTLLDLF